MSLLDKLVKVGSSKHQAVLSKSKFFDNKETITTDYPAVNIVMSGEVDGGFSGGLTILADLLQCKVNKMDMKRESIGSGFFIAPKRYVMKVYDNEGVRYKEPKIKIVGHEAVRSGTPKWVQGKMEETFSLVFDRDKEKVQEFIKSVEDEFRKLPLFS